jgi:nucleoid DNA-binding protein
MNRKDLVETIAQEAGLSAAQADAALAAFVAGVTDAVAAGDRVAVAGFGTFESRERSARTGRNPQTGQPIEIAASVAPAFKPATAFKQAVARG